MQDHSGKFSPPGSRRSGLVIVAAMAVSNPSLAAEQVPLRVMAVLAKEQVIDKDTRFTVTAIRDNRCPADVRCVHAGEVQIDVLWNQRGRPSRTLPLRWSRAWRDDPVTTACLTPWRISIVDVQPQRFHYATQHLVHRISIELGRC
jgi:hypothetical protein